MVEMSTKCVKRGGNGCNCVKNATSPMWKKHQNLLSNNNNAPSITKHGFRVWSVARIVALCAHCA